VVSARFGAITTGEGNDLVTWVAHSDATGANNTMVIRTGAGNDTVRISAVAVSRLDSEVPDAYGSTFNPAYNGRNSTADVYTGAGTDTVTTEGLVRLVLHGGTGTVKATGAAASDTFYCGQGAEDLTGGAGNDWYVLTPGSGHVTVRDFASGQDHLKFIGVTAANITTRIVTENGVQGLRVTYDAANDSVFLANVTKLAASDMVFA
jgi:Ca2+-binding RTX toxin-like protein